MVQVQVGPVETTHPKAGSRIAFTPPPPTAKVRALLPQLADLPAEAEQKQKSEAELKKDLAAARATITRLEQAAPLRVETKVHTQIERVMVPMLTEEHLRVLQTAVRLVQETFASARGVAEQIVEARSQLGQALHQIDVAIAQATKPTPRLVQTAAGVRSVARSLPAARSARAAAETGAAGDLPKGERAVLHAIAHYPEGCSRKQLTVLTGYRRSMREHWRRRLPEGERKILDVLVAAHPESVEREAITEVTGYARSSRDTYLQRLGAKRLIETKRRGPVRASAMLFDEGAA